MVLGRLWVIAAGFFWNVFGMILTYFMSVDFREGFGTFLACFWNSFDRCLDTFTEGF